MRKSRRNYGGGRRNSKAPVYKAENNDEEKRDGVNQGEREDEDEGEDENDGLDDVENAFYDSDMNYSFQEDFDEESVRRMSNIPMFNEKSEKVEFCLGMVFKGKEEFKKVVRKKRFQIPKK